MKWHNGRQFTADDVVWNLKRVLDAKTGSSTVGAMKSFILDEFETGEKDDKGRMPSYGKVAIAAVVGNEDGAHHVAAELLQALLEVGFSAPPGGVTYWVGEAMGSVDYVDLRATPKALSDWTPMLASNTAHLARLLKDAAYPGKEDGRRTGAA